MREKRKLKRFDLRAPANIEIASEGPVNQKEIINLWTKNICAGGAFFPTRKPLVEGTLVKINVMLDKRLKDLTGKLAYVILGGRVLRSEPGGMAICFHENFKIMPLH